MRQELFSGRDLYHFYPSVTALIEQEIPSEQNREMWHRETYGYSGGESWYGVESAKAVDEALLRGWKDGTDRMRKSLDAVELPRIPSIKRKRKWRDQGDDVCIHRVNSGRLTDAWRRTERETALNTSGSHITIAVDAGCNCGVTSDDAMWRGAAAVAIADAAIMSGRSVRMITCFSAKDAVLGADKPFNNHYVAIEVKAYHQNVSVDVMMTMASLVGFFRVHGFKAFAAVESKICPEFGKSIPFARKYLKDGSQMIWIDKSNLSVDAANRVIKDAAKAMVRRVDPEDYRRTG